MYNDLFLKKIYLLHKTFTMKKILAIIIICLTIFLSCLYLSKNINRAEHSISVQWDWEVYVSPDTLILSFRVEETAPTTAEAQKITNEKIDKVKEIIKQFNVDSTDIKTTNVNVYEQFDRRESGRVSLWYTATHSLEVKIKKANVENEWISSKIIAQVSEIGGVLINNISYDIEDKAPFYAEARKLAMEKAHQKASDLAKYWNVKLWNPISITEDRSYDYAITTSNTAVSKMSFDADESINEMGAWGNIELWEMKLMLNISVIYEIK